MKSGKNCPPYSLCQEQYLLYVLLIIKMIDKLLKRLMDSTKTNCNQFIHRKKVVLKMISLKSSFNPNQRRV